MPLAPGAQLGPYEILAQIGAGGMGEVYRARDHKLDRLVAIKILPVALGASGDFLARFEREAKAVAALNHPNILGIYDFDREGEQAYAVMELLEGGSLRDLLKAGPLAPRKAVELAQQVAEGLAAAHAKGIIHRDLKPENLLFTRDGRVKVLDFGLAKQLPGWIREGGPEQDDLTQAPSTMVGSLLGTVGYMAPEQVEGVAVDHRADIFAFGVVLYEMLAGRRPFQGRTAVQTLQAILDGDPPPLDGTRVPCPPALDYLVGRCLDKDPEQRYQSMKDLALELKHLATVLHAPPPAEAARLTGPRRWLALGWVALLVPVLAFWAAGLLRVGRPAQPPAFTRLTRAPGTVESAFFGPDGKTVYFSERIEGGKPEVFVLHPESPEPKALDIKDAILLGVSASSELAILHAPMPRFAGHYRGMLAQVGGGGGPLKEIQENAQEATWDGTGLAFTTCDAQDQFRLEFAGKVVAEHHATARLIGMLRVARDGALLAAVDSDTVSKTEIVTYDRAGVRTVRFTKTDDAIGDSLTGLAWGPRGELWYSELLGDQTAVWGLTLNGRRRLLWRGEGRKALMDVSLEGRMLLANHQVRRGVLVRKADGSQVRDLSVAGNTQAFGLSEDGQVLLLQESPIMDGGTPLDVAYIQRLDGSPPMKVAHGTAFTLSPDGRWVQIILTGFDPKDLDPAIAAAFQKAGLDPKAVLSPENPPPYLLFVPTGAGRPFAVALGGKVEAIGFAFVHPDGKRVLFNGIQGSDSRYWSVGRGGGDIEPVSQPGFGSNAINLVPLSPDGSRLIVVHGGRFSTQPLAAVEPQPIRGLQAGENPLGWSRDQKSVFVRNMGALPVVITRVDLASAARQEVLRFMPGDVSGLLYFRSVRMTTDARTFAFSYVRKLSDLYLVEGLD